MRYLIVIVGLLVLVGGLVAIKGSQIGGLIAMGKAMEKSGPPPEFVSTSVAETQKWEGTISAVGSIAPVKGVAVSNDAPGVVVRIGFESGAPVHEGQVLLELDSSVERAQLSSAHARLDLAKLTASRSRTLVQSNAIAPAQLDNDEAQLKAATSDIEGIQAQIARKTIHAPFAGRLGIRNVNLGQYLNPGTQITVLEAIEQVYVDFPLPQQRLSEVKVGMPVRITLDATVAGTGGKDGGATSAGSGSWEGTVKAIDPTVDSTTRTLKLRAAVPNKEEKLRPGMFASVTLILPERAGRVIIPQTAVIHASYGDSVFVVEDKKPDSPGASTAPGGQPIKVARQQFVRVGDARGDFVSVLEGVKNGDQVVSAGGFKLRNGAPLVVDNTVTAKPQLHPTPENH